MEGGRLSGGGGCCWLAARYFPLGGYKVLSPVPNFRTRIVKSISSAAIFKGGRGHWVVKNFSPQILISWLNNFGDFNFDY